jgi:hypothetical protein
MVIRAIALSLALLVGIGAIIPMATGSVEAGPRHAKYRKHKKYKKYSKAWWRQYRARMNRKKAMQARKRSLRLRQLRLARKAAGAKTSPVAAAKAMPTEVKVALLPSGQQAPASWKPGGQSGAEVRFRLQNGSGVEVGDASISVIGPASGASVSIGRNRSLAGVPTSALRREVINRMIAENGWVVNDYQKEVGGKTIYVVVAQSQVAGGRVQSRMFYFTEADGRIYSVATRTDADVAERMAEESEKVIQSLQVKQRPVQQASARQE